MLQDKKLGPPDPNRCSYCGQLIIHGKHNAVHIYKQPERIMGLDGGLLGIEGKKELKAAFHAECYQKYKPDLPGRIECQHCGILSMATVLPDGRPIKDVCKCSCHEGKNYCSLLIL